MAWDKHLRGVVSALGDNVQGRTTLGQSKPGWKGGVGKSGLEPGWTAEGPARPRRQSGWCSGDVSLILHGCRARAEGRSEKCGAPSGVFARAGGVRRLCGGYPDACKPLLALLPSCENLDVHSGPQTFGARLWMTESVQIILSGAMF